MTPGEFLVSIAAIYEAGATPLDPAALARQCRDYATIAQHEWEAEPIAIALPACAALPVPELPVLLSPAPPRKKPRRPKIF